MSKFFEDVFEAISAAEKIKRSAAEENRYLHKKETSNQMYFMFNVNRDSSLGQSSIYKDEQSMDSGIQYMKEYLAEADIVDLTS